MKKNIRVSEPSPEMQEKIRRARSAIVNQKMRMVKCPYCGHNAIAVFEDSRGHIQAKCKALSLIHILLNGNQLVLLDIFLKISKRAVEKIFHCFSPCLLYTSSMNTSSME